ncbi:MAG: 23S rRNA (pseudouridine(1915)-N(3))-methyltransferase RlmH [Fibrobacterota bacterium]
MAFSVTIIGIGKEKQSICGELERYRKMLRPYCTLDTIFLKAAKNTAVDYVLEEEKKRIEKKIPSNCTLIVLGEEGKQFSSEEFACWVEQVMNTSQQLVFVIGGAYGVSSNLKKKAQQTISLSSMTFPHRLCWVLLAEQFYRAFTILKGHPYHKQ